MKIDIGIYYGPIDLLVYLVRKKEVDIFDIPIAQIAEEYLDYIRKIEREDLPRYIYPEHLRYVLLLF